MATDGRDPFEGLHLDESFVRSARFVEPSAEDRVKVPDEARRGRCRVEPAHRGVQGLFCRWVWAPYLPRARRARRLGAILILLGATAGLGLFLMGHRGPGTPVGSTPAPSAGLPVRTQDRAAADASGPTPGSGSATSPASAPGSGQRFTVDPSLLVTLRPGDCLSWNPDPSRAVRPVRVSCDQPHLDLVIRVLDPVVDFPGWPGRPALEAATAARCTAAVRELFGPAGIAPPLWISSIYPEEPDWLAGARGLVCTVRTGDPLSRVGPGPV